MDEKAQNYLNITFEPEEHLYFIDGAIPEGITKELKSITNEKAHISVTALISKQITKDDCGWVSPDVLKAAADRGTDVHADLEFFVGGKSAPRTPECKNFAAWLETHKLSEPLTEFKLATAWGNLLLAGTADLIGILDGVRILADYKTTSVIHEESVRWQLSLLDYMARKLNGHILNGKLFTYLGAEKLFVFHFDKKAQFVSVEMTKISDVEIERLLAAEAANEDYTPATFITPRIQSELLDIQRKIVQVELVAEYLDKQEKELKKTLMQAFLANPDIKKVECPEFSVSYVKESIGTAFDAALFQEENPEIAAKYQKSSYRAGYVKITLNKEVKAAFASQVNSVSEQVVQLGLPVLPTVQQKREKATRDYFER